MRFNINTKRIIIDVICLLYVFLFVYAATSKLFDFQNFRVQLGQSPLLSAFADWISVLVPATELVICILLIVPRFRFIGLFACYGLMVMFTAYIFIVLHYTTFVPCSCGGVLEKLNWTEHLIFNCVFIVMGALAIFLYKSVDVAGKDKVKSKTLYGVFFSTTLCSIVIVIVLFLLSENIVQYHNRLIRRFPHTPVTIAYNQDLLLNSYYITGVDSNRVYLGNTTAPLLITVLDMKLGQVEKKVIDLDRKDLPFQAVKIIVNPPYFFVIDGRIPCVYRGNIKDWKAKIRKKGGEYFTTAEAIDSTAIAVRTHSAINGESILGVINLRDTTKTILNPEILEKQFDGVFDTDGQLLYSSGLKRIVFLYAYRNQFTVADHDLKIDFRGNTIDTITRAKLSIVKVEKHHQRKFSKPPLFVNKSSAVYNDLLFVNSAIPGRYEEKDIWKNASIIDVYDIIKNRYLFSFCIYDIKGKKVRNFVVYDNKLFALIGSHIVRYDLDKKLIYKYKK